MTSFDPARLTLPSGQRIAGKHVPGDGDEQAIIRPSDQREIACERSASTALVDEAVHCAQAAQAAWGSVPRARRAQVLERWANLVDRHADALARLEAAVSTRLIGDASTRDVPFVASMLRCCAAQSTHLTDELAAPDQSTIGFSLHEPHGVVAAIAPWNAPLLLAIAKVAPALAAGNAVVLKPSELTPHSALYLCDLAAEAGLPAGCFNIVTGTGAQTGRSLVRHPQVDFVAFTGSSASGRQVMADAASGPKPVSLELGGKTPHLVFADAADVQSLAALISAGVIRNAGQVCFAGTRLICARSRAAELIDRISACFREVKPGPTWSANTTLAPIVSQRQARRIESLIETGLSEGATIIQGGRRLDLPGGGIHFEPTLVAGADVSNTLVREEVFGPVLCVETFEDDEHAFQLAAHPQYGLAAAVHTRDLDRAMAAARRLKAGTVWINDFGLTTHSEPFGGFAGSGFGKEFGKAGLEKYYRRKWLRIRSQSGAAPSPARTAA